MSIRRRLINLARAELNQLLDRVGQRNFSDRRSSHEGSSSTQADSPQDARAQQIRQYYANLELEPGAPWSEVKHAYRRLMRQYHPDRHHSDPDKELLANQLSQKLRVAYEELKKELKAGRS